MREKERFIERDSWLICSSKLPLPKPPRRRRRRGVGRKRERERERERESGMRVGRFTAMQLINLLQKTTLVSFWFLYTHQPSLLLPCSNTKSADLLHIPELDHLSAGNGNYSLSPPVFLAVCPGTMEKKKKKHKRYRRSCYTVASKVTADI